MAAVPGVKLKAHLGEASGALYFTRCELWHQNQMNVTFNGPEVKGNRLVA